MGNSTGIFTRANRVLSATETLSTQSNDELFRQLEALFDHIQAFKLPEEILDAIDKIFSDYLTLKESFAEVRTALNELKDVKKTVSYAKARKSIETNGPKALEYLIEQEQRLMTSDKGLASVDELEEYLIKDDLEATNEPPLTLEENATREKNDYPEICSDTLALPETVKAPIPLPPPPMPMSTPSKYKKIFWTKLDMPSSASIFTSGNFVLRNTSILDVFVLQNSKKVAPAKLPAKSLNYTQELKTMQSVRILGISPDKLRDDLLNYNPSLCNNEHKLGSLVRGLPEQRLRNKLFSELSSLEEKSPSEQLMHSLLSIPNVDLLLENYLYMARFENSYKEYIVCLQNVSVLCQRIMTNRALQEFISLVLSVGNHLNHGHLNLENAKGFKIDILNNLSMIKSSDNRDLLEVLISIFVTETRSSYISSISEHYLLQAVANSDHLALLNSTRNFIQAGKNIEKECFSSKYVDGVQVFLQRNQAKMIEVISTFEKMNSDLEICHSYFLEKIEFDQEGRICLFKHLSDFYEIHQKKCNSKTFEEYSSRESRRFSLFPNSSM